MDSALGVHLYGIASGRELRVLEAMPVSMIHLAFSPDGKTLALATHDRIEGWIAGIWQHRFGRPALEKPVTTCSSHLSVPPRGR
jgi:hypothetical protein